MVSTLRVAWLFGVFFVTGCAGSGPTIKDYQVIAQALQAEARQAQRTITDLEAQRQAVQRDLGEARTAKARLEGEMLDAERRLLEARHIVELQREELSRATAERQRVTQAAREEQVQLHAQLQIQTQAQLIEISRLNQQVTEVQAERARLQAMDELIARQATEMAELKAAVQKSLRAPGLKPANDSPPEFRPSGFTAAISVYEGLSPMKTLTVRRGDSLWMLARRYRVALDDLIELNRLETDLIVPGQKLRLPDPAP
jgi:nucleoid-associated protein YgaU